jgi:predicted DCC family thiol-disulfide oxidoreductase YuxK
MSRVILFDGVCKLCEYSVCWIQRYDGAKQFQYVSLQSEEGQIYAKKYGVDLANIETVLYIIDGEALERSDAFFAILKELDSWPRFFYFLRCIPKPLRDGLYGFVARYRYRLFGKRQTCFIP